MNIKVRLAAILATAILKRLDFEAIGKNLDLEMDKYLGERVSEKIQRGPITSSIIYLLRGLWAENKISLAVQLEQAARNIREDLKKGE